MHFTKHVSMKEWVQNLEGIYIVFCRALRHKQNLPTNAFCCAIQTNTWAGSVFRTSVGGLATFKEKLLAPKEALIKAACAYEGKECKVRNA